MDEVSIKLIDVDENDISMPSISVEATENSKSLISESIDDAILGSKVKTLIVPEDTEISPVNYVFDFSSLETINVVQKSSLKSLVCIDGDVQLYIYNDKKGLIAFGNGDKYSLERIVPLIKKYVFNNEIKVYKNFQIGKQLKEVDNRDITKMRLNL